ncbi:MAG: hypothetical protein IKI06_09855 [Prevotella sp.]|nr:hypothetical protein [Prevotella sp.]
MTNGDLYIMFNDFLNGIDLKYGGNGEVFINCSIRWFNKGGFAQYKNRIEKKKVTPIIRSIKEAEKYNEYLSFYGKDNMKWLNK